MHQSPTQIITNITNKILDNEWSYNIDYNVLTISPSQYLSVSPSLPYYISNCFNSINISFPVNINNINPINQIKKNNNNNLYHIQCSGLYHNLTFNTNNKIISPLTDILSISITYNHPNNLQHGNSQSNIRQLMNDNDIDIIENYNYTKTECDTPIFITIPHRNTNSSFSDSQQTRCYLFDEVR